MTIFHRTFSLLMFSADQSEKLKDIAPQFSSEGDETGRIFDLFAAMPEQYKIAGGASQEGSFLSNVKQDTKRNVWIEQNWGSDKPSFTLFINPGEFDTAAQIVLEKYEVDITALKANLNEDALQAGCIFEKSSFILMLSNRTPRSFIEYHIADLMNERIGLCVFDKELKETQPACTVYGSVTPVMGIKYRTKLDVNALVVKAITFILVFGMLGLFIWNHLYGF